MGCWLCGTNE